MLETGKQNGILQRSPAEWLGYGYSKTLNSQTIENLIKNRNEARRNKDFKLADEIRDKLKIKGIEIEDTNNGTIWRKDS